MAVKHGCFQLTKVLGMTGEIVENFVEQHAGRFDFELEQDVVELLMRQFPVAAVAALRIAVVLEERFAQQVLAAADVFAQPGDHGICGPV